MDAIESQKHLRRAVLTALYNQRFAHADQPGLLMQEIEALLSCSRRSLEFNLWYLRESGLIDRKESGRFTITARGVDTAEATASQRLTDVPLMAAAVATNALSAYKGRRI